MRQTIGIILFSLIFVSTATAEEYAFRKANWGMSRADVIKSEGKEPTSQTQKWVGYEDTVIGMPCVIFYTFINDKLTTAKYAFIQEHTNRNDYISEFKKLQEALIKKYGKPTAEHEFWKNNLYRDDYEQWGFAISLGHLSYFTTWETEVTEISLGLYGNNYKIRLGLEYYSKELKDLVEEKKEEEIQDQL